MVFQLLSRHSLWFQFLFCAAAGTAANATAAAAVLRMIVRFTRKLLLLTLRKLESFECFLGEHLLHFRSTYAKLDRTTLTVERCKDRARTATLLRTVARQSGQRLARFPKLLDLLVERRDPGLRELAGAGAVVRNAKLQELAYLVEGKTRRLRRTDEFQTPQVIGAIASNL